MLATLEASDRSKQFGTHHKQHKDKHKHTNANPVSQRSLGEFVILLADM
jgi:hypothetical protein